MNKYYFTSESVTEGHPDKLCDYISDSILDECLKQDKNSRVANETFVSANTVTIAGQITSTARLKIGELVREKIKDTVRMVKWPKTTSITSSIKKYDEKDIEW